MAKTVRNISMSLKILLGFLFTVLLFTEWFDGLYDISDWAVSLFLIIMFNDIYVHFKLHNGEGLKSWTLSKRIRVEPDNKKFYIIYIMNLIFFMMIIGSIFVESLVISQEVKESVYKACLVIWSGVFLASNLYNLKEKFRFSRLVVTNVALIFLLGSIVLV